MDSPGDGDEQDPAILICDLDFEIRIEILDTENLKEDQALGQRIVALINTYFRRNEGSRPDAASFSSPTEKQQTKSRR